MVINFHEYEIEDFAKIVKDTVYGKNILQDINGRSTTPLGAEQLSAEETVYLFNLITSKMKELKKFSLCRNSKSLSIVDMTSIVGGRASEWYYFLGCSLQQDPFYVVNDCSEQTMMAYCNTIETFGFPITNKRTGIPNICVV